MPINKVVATFAEAVADIPDGATLMIDGFAGPGGTPQNLILALRDH
ncbi:MAG: 3-oxoadipate CoA-transferase, partial [Chloroflexi bacterium]|nr:3-oxoadipate CoA-transferase [Chloroflexota bacterium]